VTLLVVAKAPEPGRAKTRLAATVGDRVAAEIAAAALLDTLDAVAATPVAARLVALTGDLDAAANPVELHRRLASFTVIQQRGNNFGDRLANAHADAADAHPVLQIGMDTPQITAELLTRCARRLLSSQAVLGPARDGGWWVLGLQSPAAAECLRRVPMSRPDTGELTYKALRDEGVDVTSVELLADFDVVDDIAAVRAACDPASRFAQVTRAAGF
jgi:rSAM/selenodomain-associated transferase 1